MKSFKIGFYKAQQPSPFEPHYKVILKECQPFFQTKSTIQTNFKSPFEQNMLFSIFPQGKNSIT